MENETHEEMAARIRERHRRIPQISRISADVMWVDVRQKNTWCWAFLGLGLGSIAYGEQVFMRLAEITGLPWLEDLGPVLGVVLMGCMLLQNWRHARREKEYEEEMHQIIDACEEMFGRRVDLEHRE